YVKNGLTWEGIRAAFSGPTNGMWHPLTVISFMVESQLFGLNPFICHLTNLWLHLTNILLLFGILKQLKFSTTESAFVVAVFAFHPMHVETVAWIAERKGLLGAFFSLLVIKSYIRYTESGSLLKYLQVIILYVLGSLTKAT